MEIDNISLKELLNFEKARLLIIAMEEFWTLVWENFKISYNGYNV